jgi:hypothetical protein
MRFQAHAFASIGFLALGCGTPIFQANFDTDALNVPPSASPPGAPDGDSIVAPPRARSQVGPAPAGLSGRALFYTAVNLVTPLAPISFIARPVSPESERYYATWKAVRRYTSGTAHLDIRLENGAGNALARLDLYANQYAAVLANGSHRVVATVDGNETPHQVLIVVYPAGTYSVYVADTSNRVIGSLEGLPLLSSTAITRPTLVFNYTTIGGTSYITDDILMTEECPTPDGDYGECE